MKDLLEKAGLTILDADEQCITLQHGYQIVIENEALFKLKQDGMVIAPFDEAAELIDFILADMQVNDLT
jgi:hypothetical protein